MASGVKVAGLPKSLSLVRLLRTLDLQIFDSLLEAFEASAMRVMISVITVMAVCNNPQPSGVVYINETTTSSYGPIFTIYATNAVVMFDVKPLFSMNHLNFNDYFKIKKAYSDIWHMVIQKPVDLDKNYDIKWDTMSGMYLIIIFTCTDNKTHLKNVYDRKVYIRAIDEFMPEFLSPVEHTLKENTQTAVGLGTIIGDVLDRDLCDHYQDKYYFRTSDYQDPSKDAKLILNIDDHGNIFLKRALDYEANDHEYFTVVTAINQKNQTVQGLFHFQIQNINDSPTLFTYDGCTMNCPVAHYHTEIHRDFMGQLTKFKNGPIQATDADGDVVVGYHFLGGSPEGYTHYLKIDVDSGIITVENPPSYDGITMLSAVIRAWSSTVLYTDETRPSAVAYSIIFIWITGQDSVLQNKALASTSRSERNFQKPFHVFGSVFMTVAVLHM